MSDTPRTDAECRRRFALGIGDFQVSEDFARGLERELATAKAERDEARRIACNYEARAELLSRYSGHEPTKEESLTWARELSAERGWDCFDAEEVQP